MATENDDDGKTSDEGDPPRAENGRATGDDAALSGPAGAAAPNPHARDLHDTEAILGLGGIARAWERHVDDLRRLRSELPALERADRQLAIASFDDLWDALNRLKAATRLHMVEALKFCD